MSKIFSKNPEGGENSTLQAFISEEEKKLDEKRGGMETVVRSVDVKVKVRNREKIFKQKFVRKDFVWTITYGLIQDDEKTTPEDRGFRGAGNTDWQGTLKDAIENINPYVEQMYQKFICLKNINRSLPKNSHHFNLPGTVRLMQDESGMKSLLISDVTLGGQKEIVDLRDTEYLSFAPDTIKRIKNQILADLDLAGKNKVALSLSGQFPLDTWFLVKDTTSKKEDVYILDVGFYVETNADRDQISFANRTVKKALANLNETF